MRLAVLIGQCCDSCVDSPIDRYVIVDRIGAQYFLSVDASAYDDYRDGWPVGDVRLDVGKYRQGRGLRKLQFGDIDDDRSGFGIARR